MTEAQALAIYGRIDPDHSDMLPEAGARIAAIVRRCRDASTEEDAAEILRRDGWLTSLEGPYSTHEGIARELRRTVLVLEPHEASRLAFLLNELRHDERVTECERDLLTRISEELDR